MQLPVVFLLLGIKHVSKTLLKMQQRWFGNENIDKDDNLHGQMYLLK